MAGVGTEVVFEDERIKVWEFRLAPGETTPVHTHEHDYIFYALEGAPLQVFDENGADLGTLDVKTGDVVALKCEGNELISVDGKGHRVPATHSARNAGSTAYREILIEKKQSA